jgi:hypothetical protein
MFSLYAGKAGEIPKHSYKLSKTVLRYDLCLRICTGMAVLSAKSYRFENPEVRTENVLKRSLGALPGALSRLAKDLIRAFEP